MIIQIYTVLEDLERARIINGHSTNIIQTYKKVVYLKYNTYINLNIKKNKMSKVKLTEEELQKISDIQTRTQTIQVELGKLELAKMDIESRRKTVERFIDESRNVEAELARELQEKYGKGTINLDEKVFVADEVEVSE